MCDIKRTKPFDLEFWALMSLFIIKISTQTVAETVDILFPIYNLLYKKTSEATSKGNTERNNITFHTAIWRQTKRRNESSKRESNQFDNGWWNW